MASLLYYTYELSVIETGQVFYVGKGSGDRMLYHRYVLSRPLTAGYQRPVYQRMREVLQGRAFTERKVFESTDEIAALLEEQRRIRLHGFENLVNTQSHAFTGRKLKPEVGRLIGRRLRDYTERCRAQYGRGMPTAVVEKITASNAAAREENLRLYGECFLGISEKLKDSWRRGTHKPNGYFKRLNEQRRGTKQTPEHIAKGAAARRGKKLGPYVRVTKRLKAGSTGFIGVSPKVTSRTGGPLRYTARITDGVRRCLVQLGNYATPGEAARSVDDAFFRVYGFRPNNTVPGVMSGTVLDFCEVWAENINGYAEHAAKCQFVLPDGTVTMSPCNASKPSKSPSPPASSASSGGRSSWSPVRQPNQLNHPRL